MFYWLQQLQQQSQTTVYSCMVVHIVQSSNIEFGFRHLERTEKQKDTPKNILLFFYIRIWRIGEDAAGGGTTAVMAPWIGTLLAGCTYINARYMTCTSSVPRTSLTALLQQEHQAHPRVK